LIIDDDIALIGSANINDRSLLGMRDSEIAMVIEDEDKVLSTMGGVQSEHSKFAHTLRTNLYISHFGLTPE
jgi:phospholipase D1/2